MGGTFMNLEEMVNKYVITGAQVNAPVNKKFLENLNLYCKTNDAELLIMPIRNNQMHNHEGEVHSLLQKYQLIDNNFSVHKHLELKQWNVMPTKVDPVAGITRYATSDKSFVFASPKIRMKVVPNDSQIPRVLYTTGTVTKPVYDTHYELHTKARQDHKYGALVVEKQGTVFHARQIEANVNGKFYDLGWEYDNEKVTFHPAEALVFGDLHAEIIDSKVHKANIEMTKELQPKKVIIHDLFDGATINHWTVNQQYDRTKEYYKHSLNLQKELKNTLQILTDYATANPNSELYVVKSNHDERLDRWINEARYIKEPENNILGHQLFIAKHEHQDTLKAALSYVGTIPTNVTFLSRNDELRVLGYQLGKHGDLGTNGGKGSMRSKELTNGKSISGHTHTPEILRDTYVVGTSTPLQLDYTKGASSWLNTNAVLYPNGKVQLINVIKGRWKL